MATVTGNYVTSAGSAVPAGAEPRVQVTPSEAATTMTGQHISLEPQTVTPNPSTGAFSFDLVPTDTVLANDFHYIVRGYYLKPNGYDSSGYTSYDTFTYRLYVGADGGTIGELIGGVRIADAWVLVALTPPPPGRQIAGSYYLNASNDPDFGTGDLYRVV